MKNLKVQTTTVGLLAVMVAVGSTGCTSLTTGSKASPHNKNDSSWSWFKKPEYPTPRSMASYWKEDTLTMPGMPTARGFGGRIYFYDEKSKVVPVEGELVIHGYDESLRVSGTNNPEAADKTYHYPADKFTEHFSASEFGASYSVWLPWDNVGGYQKKITLIPTFRTKDGTVVQGQPSKVTLPGKSPTGQSDHAETASFRIKTDTMPTNTAELMALAATPSAMQTTTINVPIGAGSPMIAQNSALNGMNRNFRQDGANTLNVTNANLVNDYADIKQQAAAMQRQYMESNMRSMQVTNALLGQPGAPGPTVANQAVPSNYGATPQSSNMPLSAVISAKHPVERIQ